MKILDQEKRRQLLNERHSCKAFDSHMSSLAKN